MLLVPKAMAMKTKLDSLLDNISTPHCGKCSVLCFKAGAVRADWIRQKARDLPINEKYQLTQITFVCWQQCKRKKIAE